MVFHVKQDPLGSLVRVAVSRALRRMRLRAGLSQVQVSRWTGIHRPIVSRMERAQHTTSLEGAALFAQACGGSVLEVLVAIDIALGRPGAAADRNQRPNS